MASLFNGRIVKFSPSRGIVGKNNPTARVLAAQARGVEPQGKDKKKKTRG
jgi:hypothetical protein